VISASSLRREVFFPAAADATCGCRFLSHSPIRLGLEYQPCISCGDGRLKVKGEADTEEPAVRTGTGMTAGPGMRITTRRYSDFRPEEVTILILTCLFDFDQRVLDVLSSS
jgi:hypothetical protein